MFIKFTNFEKLDMKLISKGAEANLYKIDSKTLKKVREIKTYRITEIDNKLRKFRNKREFKILNKLFESNINVPKPFKINDSKEDTHFTFEFLDGKILKEIINEKLLIKAFEEVIKIHKIGIVHHDLTTLNMIYCRNKIFLIDFGLSDFSSKIEDRAVDLNLFFNCLKNEHPNLFLMKKKLCDKYVKEFDNGNKVIKRLENIEHRGRNK